MFLSPHPPNLDFHSIGIRFFISATSFVTGASVLLIEVLGTKLLAPYVGTSHFVWTAQITVTLAAISLGYYLGGWVADRTQRLEFLYLSIFISAVYLLLAVTFLKPAALTFILWRLDLAALASSFFLFFVPLTGLATTVPFLVRVLTTETSNLGKTVGHQGGISTIGGITGILVVSYILIPRYSNAAIVYMDVSILTLLSLTFHLVQRGRRTIMRHCFTHGGMLVTCWALVNRSVPDLPAHLKRIATQNSPFGSIEVVENTRDQYRLLVTDNVLQNAYDPISQTSPAMVTYGMQALAKAYGVGAQRVLCIGMGAGLIPRTFAEMNSTVDIVEINPIISLFAVTYFGFESSCCNTFIEDGRSFMNRGHAAQYDVIVLDTFLGDSCPSHLITQEAFTLMKHLLHTNGILIINTLASVENGHAYFAGSLEKTLRSVFGATAVHANGNGNTFFVAGASLNLDVQAGRSHLKASDWIKLEVLQMLKGRLSFEPKEGIVLTDAFNPVDFFDAHQREELRRNFALGLQ